MVTPRWRAMLAAWRRSVEQSHGSSIESDSVTSSTWQFEKAIPLDCMRIGLLALAKMWAKDESEEAMGKLSNFM